MRNLSIFLKKRLIGFLIFRAFVSTVLSIMEKTSL